MLGLDEKRWESESVQPSSNSNKPIVLIEEQLQKTKWKGVNETRALIAT